MSHSHIARHLSTLLRHAYPVDAEIGGLDRQRRTSMARERLLHLYATALRTIADDLEIEADEAVCDDATIVAADAVRYGHWTPDRDLAHDQLVEAIKTRLAQASSNDCAEVLAHFTDRPPLRVV